MKPQPTDPLLFSLVVAIAAGWAGMGVVILMQPLGAHAVVWALGTVAFAGAYIGGARKFGWRFLWEEL